jgi:RNA polymerase sigma factor (sigma-70 family)
VIYSDEKIIEGIKNQDEETIKEIYRYYYPKILSYVRRNSGNSHDAKDIFHDSLLCIFNMVREPEFQLRNASFKTLFYSIARNYWLSEIRNRKRAIRYAPAFADNDNLLRNYEENIKYTEAFVQYHRVFHTLHEGCKNLLLLFFKKVSLKEICRIMKHKNENYTKKKKFQCKEELIRKIKNTNWYKEKMENHETRSV